jgi:hypothetical protein
MPDDCKVITDVSQPAAQSDVVMLRPRKDLSGGKADRKSDKGEDEGNYRNLANIIGGALIAVLIGTGVWLAHAIADIAARTG